MTIKLLNFESPYGCRWCGTERRHHGRRWKPIIGMHSWIEPPEDVIKDRMLRRLDVRLNPEPVKFHATTGWAGDHTGESADPYCADCKTDSCPRWARIQTRLDQQRWGMPRRIRSRRKAGGWGGAEPWPF